MKAQHPPLRFPALWLTVSSSPSSNCFSLALSISASFNHCRCIRVSPLPPLHQALTPIHPLFPSPVQGAKKITLGCAEQIVRGVISLFNSPHLTHIRLYL